MSTWIFVAIIMKLTSNFLPVHKDDEHVETRSESNL